jgi:hypothetical protein
MSDNCEKCIEKDSKIKALERDVMIWKGAACCNQEPGARYLIKKDPYSPIGVKFEPVIE